MLKARRALPRCGGFAIDTVYKKLEPESQALWDAIREAVWLRRMCREFGIEQLTSTVIESDSQIAIRLTEEHCESERSKHWDAEYGLITMALLTKMVRTHSKMAASALINLVNALLYS